MTDFNMTTELVAAGTGLAGLLNALRPALIAFLLAMAVVVGVIGLWKKINELIGKFIK